MTFKKNIDNYISTVIKIIILLIFIVPLCIQAQPQSKIFDEYVKKREKSLLPDFSYVGYHQGQKNIPEPDYKIFNVVDYGAKANDLVSDKKAIRSAIAAAEKNGSGIVFFPSGRFLINESEDDPSGISVKRSNIILRGSGAGTGGTELFMNKYMLPLDTTKMWSAPPMFSVKGKASTSQAAQITGKAATGGLLIDIDRKTRLKKGDWVMLKMQSNDPELLRQDLGKHTIDTAWTELYRRGVQIQAYYQIRSVSKNRLTINAPLAFDVNPEHGWEIFYFEPITEIGIENIAFVGNWKGAFKHHRSWKDDSAWKMLSLENIANSWIRNCRFTDLNVAASVSVGANVSFLNCRITGTGGHESIRNSGATNILLAKLTDEASAFHSFGVDANTINTVIWRCTYPSTTSFEAHSSQPRNTLLDLVEGGLYMNRGGGALKNMPNHLRNLVLWNYKQTGEAYSNYDFWPKKPWYWRIPDVIVVGFHGAPTNFNKEHITYMESLGQKVEPESLYEAQLKLRLGTLPPWLKNLKQESK